MSAGLERNQTTWVVGSVEAPFLGVSGRQLTTLEPGTEVMKLDEYGTYTVVHWAGRNGYVPTAYLSVPGEPAIEVEESEYTEAEANQTPSRSRFRFSALWRQRAA